MAQRSDRITVDPRRYGGQPCIRDLRIRVADVLELLAAGMTPLQIVNQHPDLELDDIKACREFVRSRLRHHLGAAPGRRKSE